ncbi:MAG: VOC family protein [Cyanobacteria bacterium RM1_2_2]|nr:VOC family protein [Cyanobacteria bacterium RM1_2_2]
MTNRVKPIPEDYQSAMPMLAIQDAAAAIEFYQQAFNATELMRFTEPDGKIAHAEIEIGNARIMIADEYPEYNTSPQSLGGSTVTIHLYVEDVDASIAQATAAGAKLLHPVEDQFYGDRTGQIADPFGHVWMLATHREDVLPDQVQQRFTDLCRKS